MKKECKICLNAMVGNEERVILRMLESSYKYIDYWVVFTHNLFMAENKIIAKVKAALYMVYKAGDNTVEHLSLIHI